MRHVSSIAVVALCSSVALAQPVERKVDVRKDVVILVNENVPESVRLGEYYATKRGIPTEQICKVKTVPDEVVSWPAFRKDILEPLRAFLSSRPEALYLVPTFGVPVKIAEEKPENDGKAGADTLSLWVTGRDYACVDRELELVRQEHEIEGWLTSKVYGQKRRLGPQDQLLIVSRLDGPTPEAARALVDNALYGEAYGIAGKALVDTRGLTAPGDGYAECDKRMKQAIGILEKAGIEVDADDRPAVVDLTTRASQGHYWGWYTGTVTCSNVNWRFVRGAVGSHLHSFSASALRKKDQTWTGPLVQLGITGTFGTVHEPLVTGFPDGTMFFERFLEGYTFGEALVLSNQMTSWQAVFVGDPLYAPYAAGMKEAQAKNRKLAEDAYGAMVAALDAGDAKKADEIARTLAEIGVPYEGARDTAFLVRETRARLASPEKKAKGKVEELAKAVLATRAAVRDGDTKAALAQAKKALELSPASFDANVVSGIASVSAGSARAAVAPLEAALKVEKTAEAHAWLGRALRASKEPKRALVELEAALAFGLDVDCVQEVGELLIAEKKFKEAVTRLEAARTSFPDDRGLAATLGRAQVALGDWKSAIASLDKAIADLPRTWAEEKELLQCYETLLAAVQGDGKDKMRAKLLSELVADVKSGRVKPTPRDKAAKIEDELDEVQKTATPLPELPTFGFRRQGGLPRVRLATVAADLEVLIVGPVSIKVNVKVGKSAKGADLDLMPGVYRVAVRVLEKGKARVLYREQRIEPNVNYSLTFDEKLGLVKPTE